MIVYMCAVKDRAVDAFHRPMFVQHRNQAIRAFQDEVNRASSEIQKHPDDYDLYYVGAWDESTGLCVDVPDKVELLVRAKDMVKV